MKAQPALSTLSNSKVILLLGLLCMSHLASASDLPPKSILGEMKAKPQNNARPPNIVVIFTDDQGYADLSCFGDTHVNTPRIDQMAAEGAKLTSFYMAAPVCTPSRAGLMTGCYPKRIDMATGSNSGVLLAGDSKGLHPEETTIAEVLKAAVSVTAAQKTTVLSSKPAENKVDRFFIC
jgi:arylsulfatase A-like enzyme